MGTHKYPWIPQYTWVTRILGTHAGTSWTHVLYLSNRAGRVSCYFYSWIPIDIPGDNMSGE